MLTNPAPHGSVACRRELRFTVVGLPATKGSGGAFISKSTGKPFYKHDNPRTKSWSTTIAHCAALELQRADNRGLVFTSGGIELECWFYLPRPQTLLTKAKAGRSFPHVKKPDVDKLARCAGDALSKVVWTDDSQITDLLVHKRYCAAGEFPRVEIVVREGDPPEDAHAPRLV